MSDTSNGYLATHAFGNDGSSTARLFGGRRQRSMYRRTAGTVEPRHGRAERAPSFVLACAIASTATDTWQSRTARRSAAPAVAGHRNQGSSQQNRVSARSFTQPTVGRCGDAELARRSERASTRQIHADHADSTRREMV